MLNKYVKDAFMVCLVASFVLIILTLKDMLTLINGGRLLAVILFAIPFILLLSFGVFFIGISKIIPFFYTFTSSIGIFLIYSKLYFKLIDSKFNYLNIVGISLSCIIFLMSFLLFKTKPYLKLKKAYVTLSLIALLIIIVAVLIFYIVFYEVILIDTRSVIPTMLV